MKLFIRFSLIIIVISVALSGMNYFFSVYDKLNYFHQMQAKIEELEKENRKLKLEKVNLTRQMHQEQKNLEKIKSIGLVLLKHSRDK